jgi:hypothetical protein
MKEGKSATCFCNFPEFKGKMNRHSRIGIHPQTTGMPFVSQIAACPAIFDNAGPCPEGAAVLTPPAKLLPAIRTRFCLVSSFSPPSFCLSGGAFFIHGRQYWERGGERVNGLLKVVMYAAIIHGAHLLVPDFSYSTLWAPVSIVLFLAMVGTIADRWILPRFGNPLSSLAGAIFIAATVWGAQWLFPGSSVPLPVAAWIGIVLGVVEYRMHLDILKRV